MVHADVRENMLELLFIFVNSFCLCVFYNELTM